MTEFTWPKPKGKQLNNKDLIFGLIILNNDAPDKGPI